MLLDNESLHQPSSDEIDACLSQFIDQDGYATIDVSGDKMKAVMNLYPAQGSGKSITVMTMLGLAKQRGIAAGLDLDILKQSCETMNRTSEPLLGIVIAKGKTPINGADGKFEFLVPVEPISEMFTVLGNGRVDYKKKAFAPMAQKGEVLVRLTDPEPGTNGFDITGTLLPGRNGRAAAVSPGENVGVSKDGKLLYAKCDGMISRVRHQLNIYSHYHVPGDVDYSTGNIDFNGDVTIDGNVKPGFVVKAKGSVVVYESIESASVIAGGDIRVSGCIVGGLATSINCVGNLYVHHLQNATVEVQGDVYILSSCLQSTISCNGTVYASLDKGAIVGGSTTALREIAAKSLGNPSCVKTKVSVGVDFLVQNTLKEIDGIVDFCSKNLQKIDLVIKPLVTLLRQGKDKQAKETKAKLAPIFDKRRKLKARWNNMVEKKRILEQLNESIKPSVKVQGKIYPDVSVTVRDAVKLIEQQIEHVTLVYNELSRAVEIKSYQ